MTNSTSAHGCAAVVDLNTGATCGDAEADLYRSLVWVCDHHRFEFEYEARKVAARHYSWIEREYDGAYYDGLASEMRAERASIQRVYYMACGDYIKIGVAESPEARLAHIRRLGGVRAPKGLDLSATRLLATEPGGMAREREMHRKFAQFRVEGEWFHAAPELTRHIASRAA